MQYEFVENFVGRLPLKVSPSTKSRVNHFINIHYHEEIEILFIDSGNRIVYIGDDEIKMESGDIIIIDSLIPHSTLIEKEQMSRLYQFDPGKLTDEKSSNKYLYKFLRRSKEPYILFKSKAVKTRELTNILEAISYYSQSDGVGYDTYVKGYIYVLLGFIYNAGIWNDIEGEIDSKAISSVSKAISFIENCYSDEITLDDISKVLNFNTSYFCRLFKKAIGSTAIDYLNYVRIQEAKKLLTLKEKSIGEIAFETGFLNIANFNRTFKKINNSTPSAYRKLCM